MEKNRIRPIAAGKNLRMSYSRQKEVLEMPNLIEVQKNSYQWFLSEGLKEVFDDISPIADYSGHLSLEFADFKLREDLVKYSIEECRRRFHTPELLRLHSCSIFLRQPVLPAPESDNKSQVPCPGKALPPGRRQRA